MNGDGKITEDDRTVIGNTNPKVQGGFGVSGQWKNFDFAMNFNFMLDFDVNNATAYQLSSSEGNDKSSIMYSVHLPTTDGDILAMATVNVCTNVISSMVLSTCTVS